MRRFTTTNPYKNQLLKRFKMQSNANIEEVLKRASFGFDINRTSAFNIRSRRLKAAALALEESKERFARLITLEMGKPIKESRAEIDKCIWVCNYYAEHAKLHLKEEQIKTDYSQSIITYSPLGVILGIMPWNYPFWQVFRFVAPALMAGNAVIIKHAPSVPQCALAIEEVFRKAHLPEGLYQNLFIPIRKVSNLIADDRISAVTVTASTAAGAKVGESAGRYIKKCVMELGGNDPFIVLDDANVKLAAEIGVKSRLLNCGQSCIAAKRFIVTKKVHDHFVQLFKENMLHLKMGDPMNEETQIGPMSREELAVKLERQVERSIRAGAKVMMGGSRPSHLEGAFFHPTLLTNVQPGMPVFDEEVFGPVASVIQVENTQEAIDMANKTEYGLSASLWTVDIERATRLSRQIHAGSVFINEMPSSDPRLPFGGIKKSGYGRELSAFGLKEFVNVKTVVVK